MPRYDFGILNYLSLKHFKELYSNINGANLNGAIDVVVVEQPDGEFMCSPFHVRFGKYSVMNAKDVLVDVDVNGQPTDIKMKIGNAGEAYFEALRTGDEHAATPSLKPIDDAANAELPMPRRNSIDLSEDVNKLTSNDSTVLENQNSEFRARRYTDSIMQRPNQTELSMQKFRNNYIESLGGGGANELDAAYLAIKNNKCLKEVSENAETLLEHADKDEQVAEVASAVNTAPAAAADNNAGDKDAVRVKNKRRRRRSQLKKRNNSRKESTSSSIAELNSNQDTSSVSLNSSVNISEFEAHAFPTTNENNINTPTQASTLHEEGGTLLDVVPGTGVSSTDSSVEATANVTVSVSVTVSAASTESELQESSSAASTASAAAAGPVSSSSSADIVHSIATQMRAEPELHFFSDNDAEDCQSAARPSSPIQSDSELEIQRMKNADSSKVGGVFGLNWKWGCIPIRSSEPSNVSRALTLTNTVRKHDGGCYLADLETQDASTVENFVYDRTSVPESAKDEDGESGNGTSVPQSPSPTDGSNQSLFPSNATEQHDKSLTFLELSLCGMNDLEHGPDEAAFQNQRVSFDDLRTKPELFVSPNLVVRIENNYYPWAIASAMLVTTYAFQKRLPDEAIKFLADQSFPKSKESKQKRGWWQLWGKDARGGGGGAGNDNVDVAAAAVGDEQQQAELPAVGTQTSRPDTPNESDDEAEPNVNASVEPTMEAPVALNAEETEETEPLTNELAVAATIVEEEQKEFYKTLVLSSEIIKNLYLKEGHNSVTFRVTTAYQGTSVCQCNLYRWRYDDKIVISDIDGTITRSDVLGHILPLVGKDWAQCGVAELFTKIAENGYKMLYLSARAIGQSSATRGYLQSVCQDDMRLPLGPVLLNPTSLLSAFHREVIEKKPEEFKISCMTSIRDLFGAHFPFYAGYGNRINDVYAYKAVGIPMERIFTINPKGELKHELTQTFRSSGYVNQSLEVDEYFPPLKKPQQNVFVERDNDDIDDNENDEHDDDVDDDDVDDAGISCSASDDDEPLMMKRRLSSYSITSHKTSTTAKWLEMNDNNNDMRISSRN